jgi:hypothetical protein
VVVVSSIGPDVVAVSSIGPDVEPPGSATTMGGWQASPQPAYSRLIDSLELRRELQNLRRELQNPLERTRCGEPHPQGHPVHLAHGIALSRALHGKAEQPSPPQQQEHMESEAAQSTVLGCEWAVNSQSTAGEYTPTSAAEGAEYASAIKLVDDEGARLRR